MEINNPGVVEELAELYAVYERALVENEVDTLTALFWDSEHALRFGAGENLYGTEEIQAFRKARPAAGLARRITRQQIVSFGSDCGSVTIEFERASVKGRQSQLWVRMVEGWRIVSAHVSMLKSSG